MWENDLDDILYYAFFIDEEEKMWMTYSIFSSSYKFALRGLKKEKL